MTDLLNRSTIREQWFAHQAAAVVAFLVLNLTIVVPIEVGAAVAGTVVLVGSRLLGSWKEPGQRAVMFALGAAGLLVTYGLLLAAMVPYIAVTMLFALPLLLATIFLIWRFNPERRGVRWAAVGTLSATLVLIGVMWIPTVNPPFTDMFYLHESAAEVLLEGRNPYTDAYSVSTNPFAPDGAEYVGYAYPPLTMIAFAGSHILFGDSRWASVIAMMLVVVLIIRPWETMARRQASALIALGLVFVFQPWVTLVIFNAWTDMITLPLLLAGALLWRRHPVLAAVMFGLAFGTKQYLVLALPVMLAWSDNFRWKRALIAAGVAALTQLPFALLDPRAFWDATIATGFSVPIRLDSSSLAGLGLDLPLWVVIGASVAVAVWMGRAGGAASRFLLALSATLSVAFLLGFQAFLNYWFFVGSVALFAVVVSVSSGAPIGEVAAPNSASRLGPVGATRRPATDPQGDPPP